MSTVPNKAFSVKEVGNNAVDLELENGHIKVIEGKEEWIQANYLGLIGQEGDWMFDPSEGLPWVDNGTLPPGRQKIMGGYPSASEELVEIYINQQLEREPRNEQVENVEVEIDNRETRHATATADIKSVDGELIQVEV